MQIINLKKFPTAFFRFLLIAGLAGLMFLSWYCNPFNNDNNQVSFLNHSDTVKYVGKEACRMCHGEIYESFVRTGMGSSFDKASRFKSAAVFTRHTVVYDSFADMHYHPYWKGDSLYIREFRLVKQDTVFQRTEPVHYIIGSGQHTNSHLFEVNGYVYQLPLTWYSQKKKWDLPPGFENGRNQRFSRSIGFECMSCHNAMPKMDEQSGNKFTSIGNGIDCERCHGPGELHVKQKLMGKRVDTAVQADLTIVNPRRLPWERQIDICQRCHLQGNAVLKEGKKFDDFKPGMRLSDVMDVYMPRYSGNQNELIMASHAQRLQMSRCFIGSSESEKKLSCIGCHNPHVSVKETGNALFNQTCNGCHAATESCKEKPNVRQSVNNNCVACHMQKSGTIDIPHVSVTDHRIAVPVQQKKLDEVKLFAGIYCVNNRNVAEGSRARALLAYVEKFEGEYGVLDSVEDFLSQNRDKSLFVHHAFLKQNYSGIVQMAQSMNPEEENDPWTCYRIGQAFQNLQQTDLSIRWYQRAVKMAPSNLDFQNKLAAAFVETGNMSDGISLLNHLLRLNNRQEETYTNLGFAYVKQGDYPMALRAYNRALALNPDYQQALFNKAALTNLQGDRKTTIALLKQILSRHPNNPAVQSLLQSLQTP